MPQYLFSRDIDPFNARLLWLRLSKQLQLVSPDCLYAQEKNKSKKISLMWEIILHFSIYTQYMKLSRHCVLSLSNMGLMDDQPIIRRPFFICVRGPASFVLSWARAKLFQALFNLLSLTFILGLPFGYVHCFTHYPNLSCRLAELMQASKSIYLSNS